LKQEEERGEGERREKTFWSDHLKEIKNGKRRNVTKLFRVEQTSYIWKNVWERRRKILLRSPKKKESKNIEEKHHATLVWAIPSKD